MKLAIVGISCQFGKCTSKEEVWKVLKRKENCIDEIPQNRKEKLTKIYGPQKYFKASFIENVDTLDAEFFNISPKEAKLMDPKQKLLLKESWKAFFDAGFSEKELDGKNFGVFVGVDNSIDKEFSYLSTSNDNSFMSTSGNLSGMLSGRISHYFNLKGPSLVVDTECSSGIVALNEAFNSIKAKQCDAALIAGINIFNNPIELEKVVNIQSKNYKMNPFSDRADGAVWGEGVGCLVAVPYEVAQKKDMHIYGLVDGIGINSDGKTNGIGVPDINSQKQVIQKAIKSAGITLDDISFIETHGTGTKIGDPVEFEGLERAFKKRNSVEKCGLGTVKANFGHTIGAAGIISLIKAMLAFDNKEIPGNIPVYNVNKYIDLINSPFFLNDYDVQLQNNKKYYFGISSFGLSGTNTHVVVSNCIKTGNKPSKDKSNYYTFKVSFKTKTGLLKQCKKLAEYVKDYTHHLDIKDFCFSVNKRLGDYKYCVEHKFRNLKELYSWLINITDEDIFTNDFNQLTNKGKLINIPFDGFNEKDYWNEDSKAMISNSTVTVNPRNNVRKIQTITEFIDNFFKQELGFDKVDRNKPIIELGIDSITATKFINELNVKYNLNVKLSDLFVGNSINDIVCLTNQKKDSSQIIQTTEEQTQIKDATEIQKQIYVADKCNKNTSYNINFAIKFDAFVNNKRLIECIKKIYNNIRLFRCNFYEKDGKLFVSENHKQPMIKEKQVPICAKQSDIEKEIENFNMRFDLSNGPLCRFELIEYKDFNILICSFHHIIFDGYSAILFSNLIAKLYKNIDLRISNNDYFLNNFGNKLTCKKYSSELDSYCGSIHEVEDFLNYNDKDCGVIYESFEKDLFSKVKKFCSLYKINKNNFFLTILFILMNYYTGKNNLKIDCVVSGRFGKDSQKIIGPYSHTVIIGANLNSERTFLQIERAVSNKVYSNLQPNDVKQKHSEILFTTQEIKNNILNKSVSIIPYNGKDAKSSLEIQIYSGKVNGISIQYKQQYTRPFIKRLALNYKSLILSIVDKPAKPIKELDVISSWEKNLLNDFQVGR